MNRASIAVWLLIGCAGVAAAGAHHAGCAAIDADAERLACYDRLHGRPATGNAPGSVVSETPDPVTASGTPELTEELFGRRVEDQNIVLEKTINAEHLESLAAEIENVETNVVGKMLLRLTNGQNWKQLDSKRLRLEPGDRVVIERAAMGSYLLQKRSGSSRIRVKRVD